MDFSDRERTRPKFNIAPLIDVVFLLLVFFMLASSFVEPSAFDLSTPQRDAAAQSGGDPLVVDVAVGGEIRLNGLLLSTDQLGAELSERVGDVLERPVTVRAEATVSVQHLVSVMDQVRGAGLKNVLLATPDTR